MADRKDEDLDEGRMPFFEHLVELRDRLRNGSIAFVLGVIVCWLFSEQIYDWLRGPLNHAWLANKAKLGPLPIMTFGSVVEPFWVYLSVSLWAGVFVASPVIFYQLWKFIAPGLYKHERRTAVAFGFFSATFFISGALFCYYVVLDGLYKYLLTYADPGLHPMLGMTDYLDLTRDMMLAFGAVFELPLLIYFLAMVGLVTPRGLWRFNRWFIVIAFVIGAVLTPSPDVVSQILMALPMIGLYNASILAAYLVSRKRAAAAAAEAAAERAAEEAAAERQAKLPPGGG